MARPNFDKTTGQSYSAAEWGQLKDKNNNPGLNDAWSSTVKFDDEYFPPDKTMTGAITYTIDATNAGTGNGRKDTIIGDGNTITFTGFTIRKSSLTPSSNVVTTVSGNTYTIIFLRVGSISEVYLTDNAGATPGFALSISNFSIEDANKDRLYFDTNQAPIGTTYAGFTLADPSKTITGVTFNTGSTTGHYFTVSAAYVVGDTSPTIAYDGTDDWTGTGGVLAAFTATAIANNIGLTQLSAVTLGTVTPASGQMTIAVTNPNAGNETQNQLYYKLNTEPTTWTTGVIMATSGTSVIQTGLTDGLLYNFKMVAEGDGITYGDSPDSNVVNGTPATPSVSPEAQAVLDRMTGLTGSEQTAIIDFVDAEVLNGNWALIDEFACFKLATEANALTGWKSKTMTNNGAAHGANGFTFIASNSEYLTTNFNPFNDAVNYAIVDALMGGFTHTDNLPGTTVHYLTGGWETNERVQFYVSTSNIQGSLNNTNLDIGAFGSADPNFASSSNYLLSKTVSGVTVLYKNGSLVASTDPETDSSALPNVDILIGAGNVLGTPSGFYDGIISSWIISAGSGFDHSGHNTNLNALLAAL